MDMMNGVCLSGAILVACISIGMVLVNRHKTQKTIKRLTHMIDATLDGTFTEGTYDESTLSALEAKLHRYVIGHRVSHQNLAEEKDKIKSLISDISHQTKTPIANILLYTELLLEEQDLSKEHRKLVHQISGQSEKLNFLVQTLIKTSRLETGLIAVAPKENTISDLINSVVRQAMGQAKIKDIIITTEGGEGIAYFDLKWTGEAFYNLVDNAIKYTPVGGKVHIKAIPYELFYRVDIIDTGMGIAEQEYSKIFTRFYRSRQASEVEGIGIGLFLAREIIVAQRGYIKVASELSKGSTFSVFLPNMSIL